MDAGIHVLWMPASMHCGCQHPFTMDASIHALWMPASMHYGCQYPCTVDTGIHAAREPDGQRGVFEDKYMKSKANEPYEEETYNKR